MGAYLVVTRKLFGETEWVEAKRSSYKTRAAARAGLTRLKRNLDGVRCTITRDESDLVEYEVMFTSYVRCRIWDRVNLP